MFSIASAIGVFAGLYHDVWTPLFGFDKPPAVKIDWRTLSKPFDTNEAVKIVSAFYGIPAKTLSIKEAKAFDFDRDDRWTEVGIVYFVKDEFSYMMEVYSLKAEKPEMLLQREIDINTRGWGLSPVVMEKAYLACWESSGTGSFLNVDLYELTEFGRFTQVYSSELSANSYGEVISGDFVMSIGGLRTLRLKQRGKKFLWEEVEDVTSLTLTSEVPPI